MPLVTGETWIKVFRHVACPPCRPVAYTYNTVQVPETVLIEFVGTPPFGVQGKDVMLYTLGQLKCNTVCSRRLVVIYTSEGTNYHKDRRVRRHQPSS